MQPLSPAEVRYIKLGRGGIWEDISLSKGEIHFGCHSLSHELALSLDYDAIRAQRLVAGRQPRDASSDTRELIDFYSLGSDCLWITFAKDHLWWAFAEPGVHWLGGDENVQGARMRRTLGGWRNTDLNGSPLHQQVISSKLTKTASYRRTLCGFAERDYLLRRLNGIEEPLTKRANAARAELVSTTAEGVSALHWRDFETLVDLMFSRTGWVRTSPLGGTQKSIDLILEQPTTGERAMVQVKSAANQAMLDKYIDLFEEAGTFDRLFFISHERAKKLSPPHDDKRINVWAGEILASKVVHLGLHDWVFEKST